MAAKCPPFVNSYGLIDKVLKKIQEAQTPERFTQDFLSTKLGLNGGSAKALIPYLKRIGFLKTDGVPTDLYSTFRAKSKATAAMAEAIKTGYADVYAINEYAHDLSSADLKDTIIQLTGLDEKSNTVAAIVKSFEALKKWAAFAADEEEEQDPPEKTEKTSLPLKNEVQNHQLPTAAASGLGMNLSYTINLVLPETTNVAVFNAIFKSLNENLLKR